MKPPTTPDQHFSNLFVQGRYGEALVLINQLITLDPENAIYYTDRADTYCAMKQYVEATVDYEHAIALQPENNYTRVNLGVTYEQLLRFEEALQQYDAVIASSKDYVAIAHCNRGDTLRSLKRLPEALVAYTQAIEREPDSAGAFLNRGHIHALLGKREEARVDYDQAYTLGVADINIAWTVTWSRFGRSPSEVDRDALLKIAELLPGNQHYVHFVCHAVVALLRDDLDTAMTHIHQARSMEPTQWDPPFWTGMIAAWMDDDHMAQQAFEDALRLGLPPAFLQPLYWLQERRPLLYEQYARNVLRRLA